ncbi:isochorismatase family protein [Ruegeria sp. Ofav3-42]|uniref:isochorismatase family protein n=1 Tax=Ruegeria sp. Ofav3-42 TaxID=2917759 RepID=UPI001EF72914|nr:isochorismatase family protein [Ruegeria sp. Ofav3-42]MCG7521798.1 isochorismatase family protein [Ruegeria sp. Ofav3-42]
MALPKIASYDLPTDQELPAVRGPWVPQRHRVALLVHDMQRYFCAPYPAEQAPLPDVVRNIGQLTQAARRAGIPVFYTAQEGDQFRPDRGLQADLWGPGMRDAPEHCEIIDDLAPQADDVVLVKHRYSAFQRSNLEHLLRARGRDQLLITGIYAHIGCLATAAEAFQRDFENFAVADAQADFDRAHHDMAMSWVGSTCGGLSTTDQILRLMQDG